MKSVRKGFHLEAREGKVVVEAVLITLKIRQAKLLIKFTKDKGLTMNKLRLLTGLHTGHFPLFIKTK